MESWVFRSRGLESACRAGNRQHCAPPMPEGVGGPGWRLQAAGAAATTALQAAFTSPPPILFLRGEIDESSYPDLRDVLELTTTTRRHQLQVDMAEVEYCDLAGLRAIMSLTQAAEGGSASVGQLVLRHVPSHLGTVIRILGWDTTPGVFLAEPAC